MSGISPSLTRVFLIETCHESLEKREPALEDVVKWAVPYMLPTVTNLDIMISRTTG